jgi:hypothetical protein
MGFTCTLTPELGGNIYNKNPAALALYHKATDAEVRSE